MLLKSLIFHYHGLDDEERTMLEKSAKKHDAYDEMLWANKFIAEDYMSAFERSREFFRKIFPTLSVSERIKQLQSVWEDCHKKGYVTESETTAMLILAKDWEIENEFFQIVKS
ncbi:MAG: hypothetical protein ACFHWX_21240 [Bacteroidota bacterium]